MSMFSESVLGNGVGVFYDVGNPMVQREMRALNEVAQDTADERMADASNDILQQAPETSFGVLRKIDNKFEAMY